jgi:hypothetical protein
LPQGLDGPEVKHDDLSSLHLQYCLLRMALVRSLTFPRPSFKKCTERHQSWQQDNNDLVEHFFEMMDLGLVQGMPEFWEDLVGLLLQMGSQLLSKGFYDAAVQWLSRATNLVQNLNVETIVSPDAAELKLAVYHTYGQLLLNSGRAYLTR